MRCSREEFTRGIQSPFWFDVKLVLEEQIDAIRTELETCTEDELVKKQGEIKAMRALKELPDTLLQSADFETREEGE